LTHSFAKLRHLSVSAAIGSQPDRRKREIGMSSRKHGYSGKPLFQKLGLKPDMTCLVVAAPDHFDALLEGAGDVRFIHADRVDHPDGAFDTVHVFCATTGNLKGNAQAAIEALAPGGMLWVSWPKKTSNLFIDLTEDGVREILLPTGWVDVKVCAVDGDWSALKFLKRKSI
jgi:hypothetical protein